MKDRRTYGDYEELGRRLVVAGDALFSLAGQLTSMFMVEAPDRRPMPSNYEKSLTPCFKVLGELKAHLALEYQNEPPEVPEGKPPIPPPFDKEEGR